MGALTASFLLQCADQPTRWHPDVQASFKLDYDVHGYFLNWFGVHFEVQFHALQLVLPADALVQ